MRRGPSQRLNVVIAFVLAVGLGVATTLIVLGSDTGDQQGTDGEQTPATSQQAESGDSGATPSATLPPVDMTAAALSELSGLRFPEDMNGFRSVALEDNLQFDITFTIPTSSVEGFIDGSGLPEPTADRRVLIHASPLWDLNPPEGTTISSVQDRHGEVERAVELVTGDTSRDDGSGDTRHDDGSVNPDEGSDHGSSDVTTVRISLTPSR